MLCINNILIFRKEVKLNEKIIYNKKLSVDGYFRSYCCNTHGPYRNSGSVYKLDFSEIPILIGTFIMGPVSGIIMEAIKIVLKILLKGTTTGYVGELANFCIGCCLVVPAGIIYKFKKSKKGAFIGIVVGIVLMAVAGAILNYYVMLPFYVKFMPLEAIIEEGAKVNPIIKDKWSFVWVAVAPFNVFKGIIVGIVTGILYKRISTFIKKL